MTTVIWLDLHAMDDMCRLLLSATNLVAAPGFADQLVDRRP